MSTDIPTPRSYQQILSDLIDAFLSRARINRIQEGPILFLLEAAARSDTRSSQDIFAMINAIDIDKAEGIALDRIGEAEGVPRLQERAASGTVDISDSSFTKLATTLYHGGAAPIAGTTVLNVTDASTAANSGSVYLGRGTSNFEGPVAYTAKSDSGTHWQLTLSSPTAKFHNTNESVVWAHGGNRSVGAGAIVRTPQGNVQDAVEFRTLYPVTIPDGETFYGNVQVRSTRRGIVGNVPPGAIKEFADAPFNGATVTNPLPISNGAAAESHDDYRERIKDVRQSRQRGTALAIETAVTGITAADENKRISSAKVVKLPGQPTTLYIDDGTGYEERSSGSPFESLTDNALGGEQFFETSRRPVAKAFLKTNNSAPYAMSADEVLAVRVGGTLYTHTFSSTDFRSIGTASAYEVVASINADFALGFLARTSDNGTTVVLTSKGETEEDIEVVATANDANQALGFPLGITYTLDLYKNDRLLTKDGKHAKLVGESFSAWNAMSSPQTLQVGVDGTPPLTYTFVDQDFVDAGTGFSTLDRNGVDAWVKVLNAKIPGITATAENGKIVLSSNAGAAGKAAISIVGGDLVTARLFSAATVKGADSDYVLDRPTGQIALAVPLATQDRLTIGSQNPRSFVESGAIGTITLASDAKVWCVVDGQAQVVRHGINAATNLQIAVSRLHAWGHTLRIDAIGSTPFGNVLPGDYFITWDLALDASLRGVFKVSQATSSQLVVERAGGAAFRGRHRSVVLNPVGSDIAKVLTIGGHLRVTPQPVGSAVGVTETCEIFDPNTNTVSFATPMSTPRCWHTATMAGNGKVVVVAGQSYGGSLLPTIEVYDPALDSWTTSAHTLPAGIERHQAVALANGKILISGGWTGTAATANTYVYDAAADTLVAVGVMASARYAHRLVALPSGNVLAVGGFTNAVTKTATVEMFDSGALTWSNKTSMSSARADFGLAVSNGTEVVAVGNNLHAVADTDTYQVYNIAGNTWGAISALPSGNIFEQKDAITLHSGDVAALHSYVAPATSGSLKYHTGTGWTAHVGDAALNETAVKYGSEYVLPYNAGGTYENHVLAIGGYEALNSDHGYNPCASYETWDGTTHAWDVPDTAVGSVVLTGAGAAFVRCQTPPQEITIPSGTNYTASSLADVIGAQLRGAIASAQRTTHVRLTTDSIATSGSINVAASNGPAAPLGLKSSDAVQSETGHYGSVETDNSGLGTPLFGALEIAGQSVPVSGSAESVWATLDAAPSNYSLVGLRNWYSAAAGYSQSPNSTEIREGANLQAVTTLLRTLARTDIARIDTRTRLISTLAPGDRAYLAAPYAIGPNETLDIKIDKDDNKAFSIKMSRRLQPIGGVYSSSNAFGDAESADTLAKTFGLDYDFSDHAIYMRSRAVLFGGVANKECLARYYRLGAEGNGALVRFANPDAPSATVAVDVVAGATTNVRIKLASGAPKSATVRYSTFLGVACTSSTNGLGTLVYVLNLPISGAQRTANVSTLTVTLPAGVTNHGLQIGDVVYVNSSNGSFSSGAKTITAKTATTISYVEAAGDAGPVVNAGTVSRDVQGEASVSGAGIVSGDYWRVVNADGTFTPLFANATFCVTSAANGTVTVTSGENTGYSVSPTLSWQPLGATTNLKIFASAAQTVAAVAASVNALAAVANSKCPVTLTLLGTGAGVVDRSTPETETDASFWYALSDGINFVSVSTAPGSVVGNYTFTFKDDVTGSLGTGADWANEEVYLVPATAANVVQWLNAPTVSGLFTAADIESSSDGHKVQITSRNIGSQAGVEVSGGLANISQAEVVGASIDAGSNNIVSTLRAVDVVGLHGGQWCRIQNTEGMPRPGVWLTTTHLVSWSSNGTMVFDTPVYGAAVNHHDTKLQFERQGRFVAISEFGASIGWNLSTAEAGGYVLLQLPTSPSSFAQIAAANQGLYRIIRMIPGSDGSAGTIWVENDAGLEQVAECQISVFSSNSVMPGDKLIINTPIWGAPNQGVWTVESVGDLSGAFTDPNRLKVSVATKAPTPQGASVALGSSNRVVQAIEGTPAAFVARVEAIVQNQADGSYADVRWDTGIGVGTISANAGSVVTVLDKLAFPSGFHAGTDGYAYNTGLIAEASRVIQGDPNDHTTYPGVAAVGSRINIAGSVVKRVKVVLKLRRAVNTSLANRVKAEVATVINQGEAGKAIAVSDIVAAASKVVGSGAISVISPTYNTTSDSIPVQPYERPMVLNPDSDILITFGS